MEKKISQLFEYLDWRGDLDFDASPFNEVDAGILCLLSYLDFTGLVPKEFSGETYDIKKINSLYFGRALPPDLRVIDLLRACAKTNRFSKILPYGYVSKLDGDEEKQFCGITFVLPSKKKQACIVFRGTDVTLIGWKEDFNMIFTYPVPSQEEALVYLEKATFAMRNYDLILAGHSKGGNAAIYASSLCSKRAYNRLSCIYTFDSPGFDKDLVDTSIFSRPAEKTKSYLPKDSIIGLLMESSTPFSVVESDAFGFMQHDIFSWELQNINFKRVEGLSSFSKNAKKTITKWLELLDLNQRRDFVNSLFRILEECNIYEVRDFEKISFSTVVTALKTFSDLDDTSKECVLKAIGLFFKAAHNRDDIDFE